jgi:hypothetical protein
MASSNRNSSRGRNGKANYKRGVAENNNPPRDPKNKKKVSQKSDQTIAEFVLELEEKWRIYHERQLKRKEEDLRWFYDEGEDFRLVCELADLNEATVKRLFLESLNAGNSKPIKKIYNF